LHKGVVYKEIRGDLISEIAARPYLKGVVDAFDSSKSGSIGQAIAVYGAMFPENEFSIHNFSELALKITAEILEENGAPSFAARIFKRPTGSSPCQTAAAYADTAVKMAMLFEGHTTGSPDRRMSPSKVKSILEEAFWKMCVGRAPWQLH
jgi:hypothetical protein